MYITKGNINSLVNWFHKSEYYNDTKESNPYLLCLVVAGHLNDYKFFNDIFLNKAAIDIISGRRIAIFFFSNDKEDMIKFPAHPNEKDQKDKVIPGTVITNTSFHRSHISEIQNADFEHDIIEYSQHISLEICDFFSISPSSIPCILLIFKGEKVPIIIPTKGENDINIFYTFLRDLNILTSKFPHRDFLEAIINRIDNNFKDKSCSLNRSLKINTLEKEIFKNQNELNNIEENINKCIRELNDITKLLQIPDHIYNELVNSNINNIKLLVVDNLKYSSIPVEYRVTLKDVFNRNKVFKNQCEKIVKLRILYSKIRNIVKNCYDHKSKLENKITDKKNFNKNLNLYNSIQNPESEMFDAINEYLRLQKEVEDLSNIYIKKFNTKAMLKPLSILINRFLGITKNTKELLSLQDALKKLLG